MAEEAGKTSGIEKFDGTDFVYWRMQIEDYLYGRKLHLPLLGTKPESMKAEEWALLDRQVLGVIRLTLSRSVAHNVVKEKTTADLMKALSEIDFDDEIRALIVLASLPNSWEAMRMARCRQTSGSGSALNLETRGRGNENSNRVDQNPEILIGTEANLDQANKYNAGIVGKQDALLLAVDSPLDDWVLDSGASLGCCGSGDVRISLPNGSVWLLEKVRHIPDLRRNLISVGQLDDEGHAILFVGGTWKVTKGARVLARGKKTGTLYMTSCPRDTIAVADASTDTSLWHRRLGHMSEKGMKMTPKAEKLELVHTDLWGPSPVASLGFKGIRMEKTIPGHHKNGVAERMNRTLNERARSMRLHAGLPKTFWADAVSTAAYLINRGPSVPMEFRLPEEVWSGKESKICFFIGYGDEKFGYRSTVVLDVTEIDQKKSEFVNLDELTEKCYDEALQDENSSKWELAMKDEMDSLLGNQTWELMNCQ
ncbi:Retrovirus-related Pol polyprotein from transposon TNT 1-94 [Vitis vinifera]|uniref:Retrovirus-related Pol polyprotein from transposon TNT 1-94 n=1 Tax=Vitis vinifera TaxID=29760 RepID=A0A438FX51_VITVI|nr:Retrovirus-related Pol polyprotein from transposon TNT 1-94 [Vitis vinifera]